MGKWVITAIVGVLIIGGGATYFWLNHQEKLLKIAERQALEKAEQVKRDAVIDLTTGEAGKRALENLDISKITSSENAEDANYRLHHGLCAPSVPAAVHGESRRRR